MFRRDTEVKRDRRRKIQPKRLLFISIVFIASFLAGFLLSHNNYSKISWNTDVEGGKVSAVADGGAFADDVQMTATKIDDSEITKIARRTAGQGTQDVLAYNITFTDKDGKETQPGGRVKVTINPSDYEFKAQRYALVHIDDNRNAKYLGNIAATSNNELSFYANSFSIYAIIPTRETDQQRYARYTYEFYVESEKVASQIVRDGDILNAPAAPYMENLIFMGWYRENGKIFNDLNLAVSIPDSIQTDKTIKLHARFADKIYSVIFYNPQGDVLATKTGTTGDTFNTDEYRYEVSAGYFVESWTTDSSVMDYYDIDTCDHQCSVPNTVTFPDTIRGNLTFENHDLKLYPVVREVQWVHYHTNDHDADEHTAASYTPADYAFYGDTVNQPTNPKRNGYDFIGWTTDEAGNNTFDFNAPLTEDVDLYAQWRPHTNTQYRVIFWKEKLNENSNYVAGNYEYAAHYDNTGTSGSTVTVSQTQINQVLRQSGMEYYEYDYADTDQVIYGDGSTIVNVYLKLHVYTVNFVIETTSGRRYCLNYYNSNNTATTLCQNSSYATGGDLDIHYTNGAPHDLTNGYSFQARMGENISTLYPGVGQIEINYTGTNNTISRMVPYAWRALNNNPSSTVRVSKPITMTSDLVRSDGTGATLYLLTTVASTHVVDVNYWFEKPDGSGYERSEDYSFTANSNATGFNGREVTGYDLLSSTPSGYSSSSGNTFHFYYKRHTFDLNFYNYNTAGESHANIRHGASLTNYDYVPERPSGLEEAYTFAGWYSTPECLPGTEFDLTSEIMPMSDLMLYAKWENTHYVTVSFNPNGGNEIPSQSVLYGNQARAVDDPTRTGYVFVGWRKTDGTFFSFDNIILDDTQLVASWIPFDTININYDPNGGVLNESDEETYVDTSTTAILPAPEEAPDGKYFVGWNVNGRIYYPGNVVMVLLSDIPEGSDTLTIVAEWGKEVEKTEITYDPNTGTGEPTSFTLEQNEAFIVQNASDLDFEKTGYTFKGWNTKADGSGISLKADTQWAADQRASLPNVLYAEWEINCHTLTVSHIYANGDTYDDTETYEVCYDVHYETHPSDKDNTYVGRVTSGVAEGNMPDSDMRVIYTYTKREATVTVNHVDEDGNELAETETLPFHYDDEYNIQPKSTLTPYYNYTADHATTGTIDGNFTITFTYTKKDFTLTVQHQLADGTEFDGTQTYTYKYLDTYTATPSTKDDNYEVIRTDGDATGTMEGDTTVTFIYAKKVATITTLHKDADGNELARPVTQSVDYGDTYNTVPADELLDAYTYTVDKPESAEVHGDVTVTYTYTIKKFNLKVTHKDSDNNVLASSTETLEYGTHYKKSPLNRPDYNLVDTTGVTEDDIVSNVEIVFTYAKKTFTVTINHIIEDADNVTETKTVEYGDACPAAPKSDLLAAYNYTQSGDECGDSVTSNLTVIYTYTRKHFTLTVRHLDETGAPIIPNKEKDYKYGDEYNDISVDSEVAKAYTCTTNDATSGTITSNVTITYTCSKKHFKLTTHHVNTDGTKFADDVIKDDYEYGDEYVAAPINNPAYNFAITSGTASGTITEDTEVTYTYTKKTFRVTINHIIEDADNITETKTVEYGDACPAAPKSDLLTEYNYTQSGGPCGSSITSDITVTYTYTRKHFTLTVRHLNGDGETIIPNKETDHKYGETYNNIAADSEVVKAYTCTTNDATSGTITSDVTITFTCTKRHFKLTTHHKKADGSEFKPDVVKDDYEYGDEYTAQPINDPAYSYRVTQGSATGTIHSNTEVTFTYTKKTFTVTVIHEIEGADDITETKTVEYGDACPATPKSDLLAAYNYTQSGDECGDSVTSDITVKYTYTRKRFNLIVRHLDSNNNKIIPDQSTEYKYGATYSDIKPDSTLAQAYVCTTEDATSGTITAETTITFNCTKRKYTVTTHHKKSDGTKFADDTVKSYDYGDSYTTSPIADNNYTSALTEGTATGTVDSNIEVTYTYTRKIATIIVHHVDENGNPFAGVDDVVFTKPFGDNYETEASNAIPANYEFASRTTNHAGVVSSTPIEVTYRYQKKDPNLSSTVKIKDGDDTLTNDSSTSEYNVVYQATVDGYYGDSTIKIVNKLPYVIDVENSDFDGGTYDPETNTITWTETVDINKVPQTINITKSVKVVFKDVNPSDRAVNNHVTATITLESGKERAATGDATISVKYSSKAIVHYYLKGTETSIKEDKEYTGLVGDEFTVSAPKINGYKLVDNSPAKTYLFTAEAQEIVLEYTKVEPPAPTPAPEPENPNTDDAFNPLSIVGISLFSIIGVGFLLRLTRFRRS